MDIKNSDLRFFGVFLGLCDRGGRNLADGTPERLFVVIGTKLLGCFDEALSLRLGFSFSHRASKGLTVGDLRHHREVRHDG